MHAPLDAALGLLSHGHVPLWVQYKTKVARSAGWQVEQPTEESVRRAFARPSNLGVRCGDLARDGTRLMAIDIDLNDVNLIRCVEHALGVIVPAKTGKKGVTYFVRVDYEQKTTKIKLKRAGKAQPAVDILCIRAQSVIPPSVHPDTGLPYQWVSGKPLWEQDRSTQPVYGPSLVDEIRGYCDDPDDPIAALNDMVWNGVGGGGDTHDTSLAAVMAMVRRGWPDTDIHERVNRAKRLACEHAGMPYYWPEAQKVVQEWIDSAKAKQGAAPLNQKRLSHGIIADSFLPQARDHFRYDRERACWYFFDSVCWRYQCDYRLRHAIDMHLSGELRNSQMIAGIERSLRDRPEFSMNQSLWDPDFHLFNTPGGTVDLKTGLIRPQRPGDLITRCAAVSPADTYEGSVWLEKLPEWFGDDPLELAYVQKLAGLFLIGGNPEACLPLWVGPGGDGKSVIANTYRHILGDYAKTSTDTAFLETRHSQHHEEIAWLKGARLVLVNEINPNLPWNDARIKSVTGGECQSASFKGGHLFEYFPEYKLVVIGNELPNLRSVGPEFRRRFHVLKFTRGVAVPDLQLSDKLRAESGAILRWMIDGAVRYYREGLEPSPNVKAATAEYFEENDTIQQFLEDCTVRGDGFRDKADLVYITYQTWAEAQGIKYPLTRQKFTLKLKAKGISCKPAAFRNEGNSVRCYIGIKRSIDGPNNQFGDF